VQTQTRNTHEQQCNRLFPNTSIFMWLAQKIPCFYYLINQAFFKLKLNFMFAKLLFQTLRLVFCETSVSA